MMKNHLKLSFLLGATLVVQGSAFWSPETTALPAQERELQSDGVVALTVFDGDRGVESDDDSWDFLELTDGVVVDLDNLGDLTEEDARGVHWGTARINIRATTVGDVGSVVFDYDEGAFVSVVRVRNNPYETIMWENDFVFTSGYHTLKATGYSGNSGNGVELSHVDVGFTIVSAISEGAQNVPEFSSEWILLEDSLMDVSEAPSAVLDGNLVVFGGFLSLEAATPKVVAFDLSDPSGSWRFMPDYPNVDGVTHVPIASNGSKAYLIGGYLGRILRPPPDMEECWEFDIAGNGGNGSWRALPSLPSGRGAGGAFYVEAMHTIVYSLGATRNREEGTIDRRTTWHLDLNNEAAGWVQMGDGPYDGNHIKEVVAKDCEGNEHYYMFGGQFAEEEKDHNLDDLWEYFPATDHWEQRASMIMPRGHLAAGEYSCGFLIASGAIDFYEDDGMKTYDVSYYDVPTDTWSRIGDAPDDRNTYACAVYEDAFYCTGGGSEQFSMRQLCIPGVSKAPTPAPTPDPNIVPPLYKLNCGGPSSGDWESDDPYVVQGRSNDRGSMFDPNGPDFIYNTERHDTSDDIMYNFPGVPDGVYEIEFMFAEVQRSVLAGDRIFSFSAEGLPIPEITDFDIYGQVGYLVPITVKVDVTVSDGNGLQIESSVIADDAKIQGLIITPKMGSSPPTTPAPSPSPTPAPTSAPSVPTTPEPTDTGPQIVYKINCGGTVDPAFPDWEVDDAYTTDGRTNTRVRFGLPHPDYPTSFMYNTERHDTSTDPIEYEFPVASGTYTIDIYWIEAQLFGAGQRTMDVFAEGSLVLDDFDVFAYAGARNVPFIYTIPNVVVTDGSLSLSFTGVLDDAKVNGLVITKQA